MPIPRPLGKYALSTTNRLWFLVPAGEDSSTSGKLERKKTVLHQACWHVAEGCFYNLDHLFYADQRVGLL